MERGVHGIEDLQYKGNTFMAEWKGPPPAVLARLGLTEKQATARRADRAEWQARQREMEASYRELQRDPAEASRAFTLDYAPLVPRLNLLSGRILDVGGGLGITREWLSAGVRYVVADPSADWLSPDWAFLESAFPSRRRPGPRAQALGEALPFADASFDAVLALWMLNHVLDPVVVVREIGRVLRPGGRLLLVLEDMEPSWGEVWRSDYPAGAPHARGAAWRKLFGWPLQPDHTRIRERDLLGWLEPSFAVTERSWMGVYLGFEARRR